MRATSVNFAKRMFTEAQMKLAHSRVKTGADFPKYVQEIKELGLVKYDFFVKNGQTIYKGEEEFRVESEPIYPELVINTVASDIKNIIKVHQNGDTDFPTFLQQVADAGVNKWVVDTDKMRCIYYDLNGDVVISEKIPPVGGQSILPDSVYGVLKGEV